MNILNIILKDIKEGFRSKKELALMILFPIVLIVILGTALSSAMNGDIKLGQINVLYTIQGKDNNIETSFNLLENKLKNYNVKFKETNNIEEAKKSLQNGDYACYLLTNEDNKEIKMFKNDRYHLDASFIEGILNTFVQRYNVVNEIGKHDPRMVGQILKENNKKYVNIESLNEKKEPKAIDYYGVTMTTLIIMYSSMTAAFGIVGEKNRKTSNRMIIAPITKKEIFMGKILSSVIITVIEIIIVIMFSKYVIKVNWGDNLPILLLVLFSEIVMAVSIGIGVAFLTKTEAVMNGILNAVIPVMVFLGGGYVPIDEFKNTLLTNVSNFSPIRWVNSSILNIVFTNNYEKVFPAVLINFSIAFIFLMIASMLFRKEEA
ncbi:ABC transporter permease [Clostridium sp. MB40-C1]|uniref:ABC transporter permease n=1 Tax=Clostridium sp. MB40-C1 TaxID=3070996 RepID=UPI0027E0C1B7|nr:ABC transporter permease [Clostridium sp. MB40-C1]WMJ79462.1 ABC transporter permease [Clostridium sp. MB40-C1]